MFCGMLLYSFMPVIVGYFFKKCNLCIIIIYLYPQCNTNDCPQQFLGDHGFLFLCYIHL